MALSSGKKSSTTSKTEKSSMPQAATKPTSSALMSAKPVSHAEIAQRAYEIWQANGCPEGQQDANWLQAEREIRLGRQ